MHHTQRFNLASAHECYSEANLKQQALRVSHILVKPLLTSLQ